MEKGFTNLIIIIIIGLALLKYFFDFSIFDILAMEKGRATLEYVQELVKSLWEALLALIAYIR